MLVKLEAKGKEMVVYSIASLYMLDYQYGDTKFQYDCTRQLKICNTINPYNNVSSN